MQNNQEEQIVLDFARKMLEKIQIRHNRYVPLGWKTMDMKRLISLLEGELAEMKEAALREQGDEAIDIANYAMFIYEKSKE